MALAISKHSEGPFKEYNPVVGLVASLAKTEMTQKYRVDFQFIQRAIYRCPCSASYSVEITICRLGCCSSSGDMCHT